LARRETDAEIVFLISHRFLGRDRLKIWQTELAQIRADIDAEMHLFDTALDAFAVIQNRRGIIIAASESNLSGHADTHNVFRTAPPGFTRITLQHGFESVGFLHNREHIMAHGRNITFAADILCGWCDAPVLSTMPASQRSKLYVTGPSTILQRSVAETRERTLGGGLVCENLHSVRLKASGNHGASFMDVFFRFCDEFGAFGLPLTLRPHPGGQYVLKSNVKLPDNVTINNLPIYKANLSSYQFGISAPSTVILDMLLAGIPTAVWHDEDDVMDYGNYRGLIDISNLRDWLTFARDAVMRRDAVLARQQAFLKRLAMPLDPRDVYQRFARLLNASETGPELAAPLRAEAPGPRRMLFIANGMIPTLQLSFLKPLAPLEAAGELVIDTVLETEILEKFGEGLRGEGAAAWLADRIRSFDPDVVVCCRYSGPHEKIISETAAAINVPVIYHVDDDLLNIPRELGQKKFRAHNRPERLRTVDHLLRHADLIYCSTVGLKKRFRKLGYSGRMRVGELYCAATIINEAELRPVRTVGYMGFDHAHDFELVLPSLIEFLNRNPTVNFELFGSIPLPESLRVFGQRITVLDPVRDYAEFLKVFASRNWDIGICPLARTAFNSVKANTKWVEYTAVGAAVIASEQMIYDECCADGCGVLVGDDGWLGALEHFVHDPESRFQTVKQAQKRLRQDYSPDRLRQQVLSILGDAYDSRISSARERDFEIGGAMRYRASWNAAYFRGRELPVFESKAAGNDESGEAS
jgi:hypothetical protein